MQGKLKHKENALSAQIQEAMLALALVASEATLQPDFKRLYEPSAWSTPAGLAHLHNW